MLNDISDVKDEPAGRGNQQETAFADMAHELRRHGERQDQKPNDLEAAA
jgi:hypothetical protein